MRLYEPLMGFLGAKRKPRRNRGVAPELPDTIYVIQHSPDAGWNDIGIRDNPEQGHPCKKNDASSKQSFHGRILPILCFCDLPKLRIGGLQQESPAGTRRFLASPACETF